MNQAVSVEQLSQPAYAPVYPVESPDFSDPDTFRDGHPYDEYRRLREQAPVFWNPEKVPLKGFWGLTRYADILHVANHPELFCNGFGYKSVDDTYGRIGDHVGKAMSRILPAIDPPEHTIIKKVFSPFFTPRAVSELEDSIRQKTLRLLDHISDRPRFEVVSELTSRLPIEVLADLLGVPKADLPRLLYWTDGIFGADDREYFAEPKDALGRFVEMFEYGKAVIDERRREPREDLLSAVANAKVDGEYLDRVQVDGTLAMFIGAGNETTRNIISSSLLTLWKFPEARQALVEDPALIAAATDELLRYVTPATHMRRTTTGETEVGGQPIAKGEKVVMFYGAANRDPEMFPDPDRFDIARPNAKRHLSFGIGIHRCIGAVLAQLELRVFLEEFLPRYPQYRIVSEPELLRHNFVHAIKRMDISLA